MITVGFWPEQPDEYNINYRGGEHLGRKKFGMKKSRISFAFLKVWDIQMKISIKQLIIRFLSLGVQVVMTRGWSMLVYIYI